MVVLPAGAEVPPYAKKKGKICRKCISKTPVITVEKTLKDEISKLSLTTDNAFFKPFIILSCESSLPPHLKQRPTPCEIGAVAYSMDTGLIDSWHQFIDPGGLPIGFTYEAQFHSTETHKIPNTQFEYAVKDLQKTYTALHTFIVREAPDCTVFALRSEQRHVQSAVDWLKQISRQHWLKRIRVLVLEDLLSELITLSGYKVPVHLTNCLIPQHLKYLSNICCTWHSNQDYIVCALGSSVRLVYASAALLYKYFDEIVWGPSHAPEDGLEAAEYTQTRDLDDSESIVSRYLKANSAVHRLPGYNSEPSSNVSYSDHSTVTSRAPPLSYSANSTVTSRAPPLGYNDHSTVTSRAPPLSYNDHSTVTSRAPPLSYNDHSTVTSRAPPLGYSDHSTVTSRAPPLSYSDHSTVTSRAPPLSYNDQSTVTSRAPPVQHKLPTYVSKVADWDSVISKVTTWDTEREVNVVRDSSSNETPSSSGRQTRRACAWKPFTEPSTPSSDSQIVKPVSLSSHEEPCSTTTAVITKVNTPKAPVVRPEMRSIGQGEPMVRPLIGRGRVVADAMRGIGRGRGLVSNSGGAQPGVLTRRPKPKVNIG